MKAWICDNLSWPEYCILVHAETRGKAKARAHACDPGFSFDDFTEIRARRFPGLDDKPFNVDNNKAAGFCYQDDDGNDIIDDFFINDCGCELCRPKS